MEHKHTDREYETELNEIRHAVQKMVSLVHNMGTKCLDALMEGKMSKAYKTIHRDDEIDQLELNIEAKCVTVVARRQPLGGDLRFLVSVQKTISDLEQVADLFVEISARTIELFQNEKYVIDEPSLKPMFLKVLDNINQAVEAFLASDHQKAFLLIQQDRHVDAYYSQIFRSLMSKVRNNQQNNFGEIYRMMTVLSAIEKIGDISKHICTSTYYYSTGKQFSHFVHHKQIPECILFLCAENSARSQIAEGLAQSILPFNIEVFSAGTSPAREVQPLAIEVMNEIGIDISENRPKLPTDIPLGKVDMVIILCDDEVFINLPKQVTRLTWLFEDPVVHGESEQKIERFRSIRDGIKAKIEELKQSFENLKD